MSLLHEQYEDLLKQCREKDKHIAELEREQLECGQMHDELQNEISAWITENASLKEQLRGLQRQADCPYTHNSYTGVICDKCGWVNATKKIEA